MKTLHIATVMIGAVAALTFTTMSPAHARDAFTFSFDTGAVAFAYSDGYWDRDHNWHGWRNSREARAYRSQYAHNYKASKHTREHNQGWRNDQDHDGIPNQFDRDRDRDGVANARDRNPSNPRRY